MAAQERNPVERLLFADAIQTLPAEKIIVVDESGTHQDMTTRYARAPRGHRALDTARRNYGSNVTLIAGLRLSGMHAAFAIEGAVNTAVFETYVAQVLAPTLQPGDIVVLDNLSCHKSKTTQHLIHARGASLLFLPPYSPDFSPIENAFAKLKAFLRRQRAQTLDTLMAAIRQALDTISPLDALGFFIHAGFLNII